MILDRQVEYEEDQEPWDDDGKPVLPPNLNKQEDWQLRDSIRTALHFVDNVDKPKNFQQREGRVMNTGKNLMDAAKRKKNLKAMLTKKKTGAA